VFPNINILAHIFKTFVSSSEHIIYYIFRIFFNSKLYYSLREHVYKGIVELVPVRRIRGFHRGGYKNFYLLEHDAV
jgi:hypothetical protein